MADGTCLMRLLKMKQFTLLFLLIGVSTAQTPVSAPSTASSQAEVRLPEFKYLEGWLGADDAYSVPLAPSKSLWLFGDTFVGDPETSLRSLAKTMVRNSIGISHCEGDKPCTMEYFWRKRNDPKPRSFLDTGTDALWYWPLDGFRRGQTLYVALLAVRNKPDSGPGEAFGFEIAGTKLATINHVQRSPEKWHITIQDLTDARLWAGVSLVKDGKYVIWYTQVTKGEGKAHMAVMRVLIKKIGNPSGHWQYLRKDNLWADGLPGEDAMNVIDQPISEMSVRYHPTSKKWLAVSTGPEFPSPRVVARVADSSVGPWSDPQTIYEFPEMKRDTPGYDKDTFCYAVKEHLEFTDSKIALTYACNSMVVAKTIANMNIYRPQVVVLGLPK
jgi:hypothetical protein